MFESKKGIDIPAELGKSAKEPGIVNQSDLQIDGD